MDSYEPSNRVRVPLSLLRTEELRPSSKLVWMALALNLDGKHHPRRKHSPTRLSQLLGLARLTIRRSLKELVAYGWYSEDSQTKLEKLSGEKVTVPSDVLVDTSLSIQARLLHGIMQFSSRSKAKINQFKYSSLSKELRLDVKTVRCAIRQLVQQGWMAVKQVNQLAPIVFTLHNPTADLFDTMLIEMKKRLFTAKFKGEALMKEFLTLVIKSDNYVDNARPGFLKNSRTGESLELDRYYLCGVGFEFNGSQHYRETEAFNQDTVNKQRERDELKKQMCDEKAIPLVTLDSHDLSLASILEKVRNILPLRNLRGARHVISYLEGCSSRYRAACAKCS